MISGLKLFYIKNRKISNIGFVALAVCISYIVTYNMPDYFGIEPIYSFFNNISISYLAAVIFYVVQVYIPSGENEKKSLEILKPKFQQMIEFVEVTMLVYQKYVEIKDKGVNIHWTDKEKIYFKYHKSETNKNSSIRCYTKQDMIRLQNTLCKYLNDIRESSVFKYCEYNIVQEITEIEENSIFSTYSLMVRLADSELSFSDMESSINKFRTHIDNLKQLVNIEVCYELEDIKPEEKVIADITRGNIEENLKSIDALNRKMTKERLKDQLSKEIPNIQFDEDALEEIMNQIYK